MRHLLCVALISLLTTSCSGTKISVCGQSTKILPSESEEREKIEAIVEASGRYEDEDLNNYVRKIGDRLLASADQDLKDFSFEVLDSEVLNAFVAIDNQIFVNRGLISFLNSEAELAFVLGHEIGHVVAEHRKEKRGRAIGTALAAATACVATGSADLSDAIKIYQAEISAGYGREGELEADAIAATLIHKSGYPADAGLIALGVFKDHEQFRRTQAKTAGKPSGTYHGVYSSHPRNDLRLQGVIRTANKLDIDEIAENPEKPGEFRRMVNGLVFGESAEAQSDPLRYYHNTLDFTFEHPEGWTVTAQPSKIIARAPNSDAALTIKRVKIDPEVDPVTALPNLATGEISAQEETNNQGLKGATGLASAGGVQKRLGIVDYRIRYLFEGEATDFVGSDQAFKTIITSFRPLFPKEKKRGESLTLTYVQVPRGATFASLSSGIRIPDAENQLRLINGYYPGGEPRTGDWIKVLR
jgi:predicted Zn-dependent protease